MAATTAQLWRRLTARTAARTAGSSQMHCSSADSDQRCCNDDGLSNMAP